MYDRKIPTSTPTSIGPERPKAIRTEKILEDSKELVTLSTEIVNRAKQLKRYYMGPEPEPDTTGKPGIHSEGFLCNIEQDISSVYANLKDVYDIINSMLTE